MLFSLGIEPIDVIFFIAPLFCAIFFYARTSKSSNDKDKAILFVLSVISFAIWAGYLIRFLVKLTNRIFYGGY